MESLKEFRAECQKDNVFRVFAKQQPELGNYRIITSKTNTGVYWLTASGKETFFKFPKKTNVTFTNNILKIYDEQDNNLENPSDVTYVIQQLLDETEIKSIKEKYEKAKEDYSLELQTAKIDEKMAFLESQIIVLNDFKNHKSVSGENLFNAYKAIFPEMKNKYHCAIVGGLLNIKEIKIDEENQLTYSGKKKKSKIFFELVTDIYNCEFTEEKLIELSKDTTITFVIKQEN
jgi:hypothetical protein